MKNLASLPHAYTRGNNPAGSKAYYSCGDCGIELYGEEVGFVAAGPSYANGERCRCPRCGEENSVDRDADD
jgi:hypothetical protein